MNLKIICLIFFFYLPVFSQNIEQDKCQLFFKEIGIRDFLLGSTYKQFVINMKLLNKEFNRENVYGIDIITFKENIFLLNERKTIAFNLKFKDDILMAYDFEIDIGNFRKAPAFYDRILKSLEKNKNKNDFIQGKSHSNMKRDIICTKNFGLSIENDGSYIYGGICYEIPIWQRQYDYYMKSQ